jgi:hypothetical protein
MKYSSNRRNDCVKLLLFVTLAACSAAHAETLTNVPAWNGSSSVGTWGDIATPTYGETVTVPVDGNSQLHSFTFDIFGGGLSLSFRTIVQNWSGTATTGSPLFNTAGAVIAAPGVAAYTFTPDLALTPGGVYILYFTVLGVTQAGHNSYPWGATNTDTYAGGSFVFSNADSSSTSTGSVSDLNSAVWSTTGCCPDLAFAATFVAPTSTPEPGTIGFVLMGALGLARRLRRKGDSK